MKHLFFPPSDNLNRINTLDGFRGNAILIVLLTHTSNWNFFFTPQLNFQLAGRSGAILFFVLSAYLLTSQMIEALSAGKPFGLTLKKFYLRRFLRIYPLYLAGLFVFGFITQSYHNLGMYAYPLRQIPAHLLVLKGAGIFWTVAVELKYYIALPFMMLACYHIGRFRIFPCFLFLMTLYLVTLVAWYFVDFHPFPFIESLPVFLMGTFMAILKHNISSIRGSLLTELVGILCLSVLLLLIPYYHKLLFGINIDIKTAFYYPLFGALWSVAILTSLYHPGLISRFFNILPLRFLGTISYSLYIWHLPVLFCVHTFLDVPQAYKIYLFFAFILLTGTLSFLLIERPLAFLKIKYSS